ncbi:MAG: hypothetical protein JF586_02440 [Burkholderiales bacterium]|nr:hypothetical protein [Burkholderiales bacterium]
MDIRQDPNAIPNFNAGGRVGELQRNEPEQTQSSVELDPTAGGDGATSEAAGHESLLGDGSGESPRHDGTGTGTGKGGRDPSSTGPGAVDGLVGAP